MQTPVTLVARGIIFSWGMLVVFSAYAQSVVSPPIIIAPVPDSIQTYTISGTVSAENCPANPAMGMPCTLSPVPGCTVSISPVYVIGGSGTYNLPNIWIRNAVTDNNGKYSITIDAQPNLIVDVSAAKAGVGVATSVEVSLVKTSTTLDLILQNVVITPPPIRGSAILRGTVDATISPSNPAMGTASVIQPVPGCTVVVAPMVIPMIYPTPPAFLPRLTVTDASGHFSDALQAGDYIVSAQKSGLGSAQANVTLAANQTITLNLTLTTKDTMPVSPIGKASIQGTVKEIINPPNPAIGMPSVLQPVPGCTVLVCAAVLPIIYNQGLPPGVTNGSTGSTAIISPANAPAVLTAQQFIAITDADGTYSFEDIPIYGTTYSVVLMAKKGQDFGTTQAVLTDGQTVTADIIIGEVVPILPQPDTAGILPGIYLQYYEAVAKTLSPQQSAIICIPSFSSSKEAVGARVSGNSLLINLPKSQHLTVKAFSLNGELIATIANERFFGAGEQVLPAKVNYSGPMLIQIQGENVSYIVKVNALRHR
jgi:hypothetical protein